MNYTNSYDEKIINFDITKGYEAFVCMFTDDELQAMLEWLHRECWYDDDEEFINEDRTLNKDRIILVYIHEWLIYDIRERWVDSTTEKLFEIVKELYNNKFCDRK